MSLSTTGRADPLRLSAMLETLTDETLLWIAIARDAIALRGLIARAYPVGTARVAEDGVR